MTVNVKDTVILLVSSLVQSLSQMLFIGSDPVHTEETTRFYIAILASLQDASSSVFQLAGNGRGGNYSNKPGWADYVSDLYKESYWQNVVQCWEASSRADI